ncbi:MAG: hypothetical protein H7301_02150 [Cryobacterium sp.]|nr:hypothetical protein [Oligoflexia bacterium]
MYFRQTLTVLALLLMSSCSLYEGPSAPRKKEFSQATLGCLKNFRVRLDGYLEGKSNPAAVNKMADCAVSALHTFAELTRGEQRDRFSPGEIRNFLQKYFLEDVVITDAFLDEVMRVKGAFMGGSTSEFTLNDLKVAETMIGNLRTAFVKLQPWMPVTTERLKSADALYIDGLTRAIVEVADLLGNQITENETPYSFAQMERLLDEMAHVFHCADVVAPFRAPLRMSGLLKELFIAPGMPRDRVTAAEWRLIFQEGARWGSAYLQFLNFQAKGTDPSRGEGRERFVVLVDRILDQVVRVAGRHCPPGAGSVENCQNAPGIPLTLIQEMVDQVDDTIELASFRAERSTIKSMIGPVLRGMLGGTHNDAAGRAAERITPAHIERIRNLVSEWAAGSRYLEAAYARLSGSANFSNTAYYQTRDIVKWDPQSLAKFTPRELDWLDGLRGEIRQTAALVTRNSKSAVFDGANHDRPRVYRELSQLTWLRPIFRALVTGYLRGSDVEQRAKSVETDGLTLPEFENFVKDYWPVLTAAKLVGPRNSVAEDSALRFREASLFTQASDGNKMISVDEGIQLVLYMLSTQPLSKLVHARAVSLCGAGVIDDFGQPKVESTCYRRQVLDFNSSSSALRDLWRPFPLFTRFYGTLSAHDQDELRTYLEMAARKPGYNASSAFMSDETQATVMILHYVESLFLRFDLNQDGAIDRAEASQAFLIFRNVLSGIAKLDPNDPKLETAFFWVLTEGSPPVNASMTWWRKFWPSVRFMSYHWRKPDFRANRLDLLKVFGTLSHVPKS